MPNSKRGKKSVEASSVVVDVPDRGLGFGSKGPEPEKADERPCQCKLCLTVPNPADSQHSDAQVCDSADPIFVAVYPRGLARIGLAELAHVGAIVKLHFESHCSIIFVLPAGLDGVELSTFELLFELIGEPAELPPAPTLVDVAEVVDRQVRAAARAWRSSLRSCHYWRMIVHRMGATHPFKSPDVVPVVWDALATVGSVSLDDGCKVGPEVHLKDFQIEVVALLSDGVDECLRVNTGVTRESLHGSAPELMLVGVRRQTCSRCSLASLGVHKTDSFACRNSDRSHADDTVAFCVAHRALDAMCADRRDPISTQSVWTILDPMCGAYCAYPLAMQWVAAQRGLHGTAFLGMEFDEESCERAHHNAKAVEHVRHPVVFRGSSLSLAFRENTIDMIVVDPPWGQRHGGHTYVKRYLPKWAREWVRVLRPGGIAIVVTICRQLFETQCLAPLQLEGLLEVEEAMQFDNKGWTNCWLYVLRKPVEGRKGTQLPPPPVWLEQMVPSKIAGLRAEHGGPSSCVWRQGSKSLGRTLTTSAKKNAALKG